jgi:diguanylate cyclase (GGDEF)-like protein/PAS domain S-box-containing protein
VIFGHVQSFVSRLVEKVKKTLPEGLAIPAKDWEVRHKGILTLLWFHVIIIVVVGIYKGFGPFQSLAEGAVVAVLAILSNKRNKSRSYRSALTGLGLVTSSAILVHFSGGYIEAHFHYFVMLAVIAIYQDWIPFLLAILFVAINHGLTGQFAPHAVYNHPDAYLHPWKWAFIHAAFVLGECAALLVGWRISERARNRVDLVLNSTGEGIIGLDIDRRVTFANKSAVNMVGHPSVDAIIGKPINKILQDSNISLYSDDALYSYFDENVHYGVKKVVMREDGTRLPVELSSNPIREHNRVVGTVLTLKDETYLKLAEEEQKKTLSLLSATLESTADGILVVEKEGKKITSFNQRFIDMWRLSADVVADMDNDKALAHVLDQLVDPEEFLAKIKELFSQIDTESFDVIEFKDGRVFERYSKPQRIGREVVGRVWSFRDVTARIHSENQLNFLATHDALTNLPNRTLLIDRLGQSIARLDWQKRKVAVLFLDMDRFKVINDTLGHTVGDILLKAVAERLTASVRNGDTVARLGGDEFIIVLADIAYAEDVTKVAEKIIHSLSKPFNLEVNELFITTSIGISLYPDDGKQSETLLKNADTAMYRAKEQGRNNYQYYSSAMNVSSFERLMMETSLRQALEKGEFLLHYQPQVDLVTNQIIGTETLIRWKHPTMGLVSPAKFIPLAEETGLIVSIGEWVLRTACLQNKAWQAAGLPPIRNSVNVSGIQFRRTNLVETIRRVLDETGLAPQYLEIELTESILMKNEEKMIAAIDALHEMGVYISIDDFGTGYSSLSYLKRFAINSLKIDQSFIREITVNPEDAAIVAAIVTLAHSLKLKVIAEAVETDDQLEFLRTLKCDEMQGYLFSKPLPAEDIVELLKENIKKARTRN